MIIVIWGWNSVPATTALRDAHIRNNNQSTIRARKSIFHIKSMELVDNYK